jgi:hypothetical protein
MNLYGFADGDPINFKDPFGLAACTKEELEAGRETQTNKGGDVCVERRNYERQEKIASCVARQIGVAEGATFLGAAPVDKRAAGYAVAEGASPFTNLISHLGHKLAPGWKFGKQTLGSNRVFGVLGRANIVVAAGVGAFDATRAAMCVASDEEK